MLDKLTKIFKQPPTKQITPPPTKQFTKDFSIKMVRFKDEELKNLTADEQQALKEATSTNNVPHFMLYNDQTKELRHNLTTSQKPWSGNKKIITVTHNGVDRRIAIWDRGYPSGEKRIEIVKTIPDEVEKEIQKITQEFEKRKLANKKLAESRLKQKNNPELPNKDDKQT